MPDIWHALFANVALISIALLAWELVSDLFSSPDTRWRSLALGAVMGAGSVASMMMASEVMPGVIFDLRTSLVAAAALFGGLPAALLSAGLALAYRISIGGIGLPAGAASIIMAYAVGLMAHRLTSHRSLVYSDVLIFALVVPVCTLLGFLFLPQGLLMRMISEAGLPIFILSFAATLLISFALYRDARQRELTRRNLIYRSMVDELPDCLNVKDTEGRFLAANPPTARLMRAGSVGDLIGRTDFDFYPGPLAASFRQDEAGVLASGEARRFDQRALMPDGSDGWLSTLKAPLRDEAGRVIGIISHNRDVTEEKRNQEIKNAFISTVSHELRTPLTSIRGSLGLVSAGVAGTLPPKAENLIRIAHTNSERLVRLINDILDMEKIESGKMMFDMQRHALRPIVEQAIETANNYMPDRRIRIVLVDDAPGSVVDADADRMHQVVTNLLSNAIKFSPPAGIVQLRLAYIDHHVEIAVSDQGAGIPLAFRDRIFGKFEQADSSSTREKGGTGLGLSITKALVQHMSGAIGFETADGAGTTFKVTLPLAADDPPLRSASRDTREPTRILICEDDAETASIIAKLLASDGYGTDLAPDFSSAQSLLRDRTYAAIALDIDLAGDSGVRLFNEVRNSHHNGNIPVIVLSAAPDEARKSLNGAAVGIIDWLAKPVDPERLHASVQKIVAAPSHHRPRILHVEDDRDVLEVMAAGLGSDVVMTFAHNLAEARAQLAAQSFELVILDIGLPDGSGLDLLGELDDATPVIIFSASDLDGVLARKVKSVMTKTKRSEIDVARSVRAILAGRS
ncbi:MAG: response regulator [Rhizobiaceae bacterium]|nr:response regulator [Rhizobiaceae bacterium]